MGRPFSVSFVKSGGGNTGFAGVDEQKPSHPGFLATGRSKKGREGVLLYL